ncbi:MAG: TonB-dependent receptor [Bacteroidales bacterium]|nr:TonB-dependent receptor [Bacteroidales bacterium]
MKKLFLLTFFTLPVMLAVAQQTMEVKGRVTDMNDAGIPGVTVLVKGTQQGTITDLEGVYQVNAFTDAVLVYSFIGYRTEEIEVSGQTILDVRLIETAYDMDEVVVIGYGTAAVKDVTGTIAVIKADEITKQPVPNIGQALQGKIAGVQVSNNGAPGSAPTIRIRGLGTVRSDASPLYVVDDVFVNDISFLSPQQIESITVLKDASSAAIYGVRAANGVIIITTKSGKYQSPKFNYSGYVGIQQISNLLDLANKDQYIALVNEKIAVGEDRGTASTPFDPNAYPDNTNWFEEILNPARIQNHNIGITGGNENATYYYGIGITSQEGLVKNNDYTRVNLRGTSDITVNKFLKAGYGITVSGWKSNNAANVLGQAFIAPPAFKPKIDEDTYTDPVILGFGNFANPAATIEYHNNVTQSLNTLANVYAEIEPVENLSVRSSFTLDGNYSQNRGYTPEYWVSVTQNDTLSHLSKSNSQQFNYTFDNTVTYNKVLGDHRLNLMAGLSFVQFKNQGLSASTSRVPYFTESTLYLSNGSIEDLSAGDWGSLIRSNSYFGRLFYSYKDRYLLTATLRRDGSSTFPEEERWGNFPSLGLGWVVSEENFLENMGFIDFLKVKASWGVLGNNQVPQNAYTVTVNNWGGYSVVYGPYGSSGVHQGASITSLVEPLLRWEIVEEYDAGIEAVMMDYHLNLDFGFYRRMTKSAIFPVPLIGTAGTSGSSYLDNNADILNTGVELTLNWNNSVNERFSYNVGGNFSFNHNEVFRLEPGTLPFYDADAFNGALATYTQEGHPIGEFYVLEVDGIFQNFDEVNNYTNDEGNPVMPDAVPGDFRYVDQNGDGFIDAADRIPYGSYTPKILYAFNLGINYGSFDFSIEMHGVSGNKIYNAKRIGRYGNENYDADFAGNRWQGEGTGDTYPSADVAGGKNAYPNTFFVESGAYFRIRNIQLGYTLPKRFTDRISSESIRIYVSAQNPFTTFSYNGFSPEIPGGEPSTAGMDYGVYPLSRITSFGLTLNF